MKITMENAGYKNVRVVKPTGKAACLRYQDMPDTAELIAAVKEATDEYEIYELAKKLVKTKERKEHVEANENNIRIFRDYILMNAEPRDIINEYSILYLFSKDNHHEALNDDGVVYRAAHYALKDLEKEGKLIKIKAKAENGWGHHTIIAYIVK